MDKREHEDGWWEKKQVLCPCCQSVLEINLDVRIREVQVRQGKSEFEDKINPPQPQGIVFTTDEQKVLDVAKDNKVFDGFVGVVKIAKTDHLPTNMEKFFLMFLATMKPKLLPKFALNRFIAEYGGNIDFYASQGIGVVVSLGEVKRFVPSALLGTAKIKAIDVGTKKHISVAPEHLEGFLKTKFGLVAAHGAMFDIMSGKSKGEFCLPNFKTWRDK